MLSFFFLACTAFPDAGYSDYPVVGVWFEPSPGQDNYVLDLLLEDRGDTCFVLSADGDLHILSEEGGPKNLGSYCISDDLAFVFENGLESFVVGRSADSYDLYVSWSGLQESIEIEPCYSFEFLPIETFSVCEAWDFLKC